MSGGGWLARLGVGKKKTNLGTYETKREAGVVWDAASVWRSMQAPGKRVLAAKWIALLLLAGTEAWA